MADRLAELEAENAKLRAELEEARGKESATEENGRAMLFMLEDLEKTQDNLARAKAQWEATCDAIADPLFAHDKEMRVVRANKAYLVASGESKFKHIIGRPYYEVFPKMDGPFSKCLEPQELQREALEFSCPVTNRIFKVSFYSIMDLNGGCQYSLHILEDITEAKRAEEKIREEMEITSHLLMLADATAHTIDIEEMMKQVMHCGHEIMGCDICLSYLWDKEAELFVPGQYYGLAPELVPRFRTEALEEKAELVKKTMEGRKLLIIPAAGDSAKGGEGGFVFSWLSEIRTIVVIPLIGKTGYFGLIIGIYKTSKEFTGRDKEIMHGLSYQVSMALEQARLISDLEELFLGTVKSLSSAIDAKSHWTAGHSERVTKYALQIGEELGLSKKELKDIELAGLLHDVGKIGTYESILDKPGKLTDEEFEMLKKHPVKGAEMLEHIKQLKGIIPGVRNHHEFYNGAGYPDSLKGEEISLTARILTVADTYDAMKANRPYRSGRTAEFILQEFRRCSGTQFDTKVVEALLRVSGKLQGLES